MRASSAVLVVLVGMLAIACGQVSSPTAPVTPTASSATAASVRIHTDAPSPPPIEPLLARLNNVDNLLTSANHQLEMFLGPQPPPIVPPNPIFPQNALDFYLKANGVLSEIAMPDGPPIEPQWNAALNAIIGDANTTIGLLNPSCDSCTPGPPPIFQDILTQANLTKSSASALMAGGGGD